MQSIYLNLKQTKEEKNKNKAIAFREMSKYITMRYAKSVFGKPSFQTSVFNKSINESNQPLIDQAYEDTIT